MYKEFEELYTAVSNINEILYNDIENHEAPSLNIITDSCETIITFLDITIYKEYEDEREFYEELNAYESYEIFLKRQCRKIITDLWSKINLLK
jgi:hypothetical protein